MQNHKFRLIPSSCRHGRHRTPGRPGNPQSEISRQNPRSANLPRRPHQGSDQRSAPLNQNRPKPRQIGNNRWSTNSNETRARSAWSTDASAPRKNGGETGNSASAKTAPTRPSQPRPAAPPAPRSTGRPAGAATPSEENRPLGTKLRAWPVATAPIIRTTEDHPVLAGQ